MTTIISVLIAAIAFCYCVNRAAKAYERAFSLYDTPELDHEKRPKEPGEDAPASPGSAESDSEPAPDDFEYYAPIIHEQRAGADEFTEGLGDPIAK